MKTEISPAVVLAGFESAGKSALFRALTGQATGDETNFRGSTVICRRCHIAECQCVLVDTPGIRLRSDSEATRLALEQARSADVLLLVVRGTHAQTELEQLLIELDVQAQGRRAVLALTFQDKAPAELEALATYYRTQLGVPVVTVNARELATSRRDEVFRAINDAQPLISASATPAPACALVQPQRTVFERPMVGPLLALAVISMMFALPVYFAYLFAAWVQPLADAALITPLKERLSELPPLLNALLGGNYGALTLGWYSFLWAFPVVLLIGLSVALTEETGLKDRITAALDPWLRRIGLSGRDLLPVLTGFGCNVVAVLQTRGCSSCTRRSCVSLIAFGSACSYQIGASLSIFGSAGHPWLFAPYLAGLFIVGALHTRIWHGALAAEQAHPLAERSFLQWPSARAVWWRLRSSLKQFLLQAMPIFLLICAVGALLEYTSVLGWVAAAVAPVFDWFRLPGDVAPGVIFSIIRKDGLLTLNSDNGALLTSLNTGQVFVLVWLAGTLTACLVTLWTVGRELGWLHALRVAGKQALTALMTTAAFAWIFRV